MREQKDVRLFFALWPVGLAAFDADAAFATVEWSLSEFALIEVQARENGVEYLVVESYPLS
jgi:hypothetical protein